ncbi:MAG TPA: choice-of-anchor Q domain-containing protein [Solirubrobacterales bacterium]|nr:choice-of-anchor Q domain-containing protein [Solirubrobacterales bacterium]
MRLVRSLFLALAVLAAALLPAGSALALSYPVTSTADSDAKGTLRKSIEEANDRLGADTVPIEVTGTIELSSALPPITDDVTIAGPGADLLSVRPAGAAEFRIFEFGAGITSSLSGVTVAFGVAPVEGDVAHGGGIFNGTGVLTLTDVAVEANQATVVGGSSPLVRGGGVYSIGPLTLRESTVIDNVANTEGGSGELGAQGGGVAAFGPLTVERSTIADNTARAFGGEETFADGGGVLTFWVDPAKIDNSTISENFVGAGGAPSGAAASGGGISGNAADLTASTVTGNVLSSGKDAFGANLAIKPTSLVRNTIVANPEGADSCPQPLVSAGFNLDEDSSCGFDKGTDLAAVSAGLAPLADNGGPTPTHALFSDSAAIDRGFSFGLATDQRNLPRRSNFATVSDTEGGDGSDIGAFELQAPPLPAFPGTRVTVVAGDRQPPNTRIVSGPARVTFKRLAKFRFASTEAQSSFQCKVDKGRWRGCRNPFKRKVGAGRKHVFKVRAIDRFGNVDPTPARFGWRVEKIGR